MRVFLTGGTGFIGSHLVRALVERGDECAIVSRSAKDPSQTDAVRMIQADPGLAGDWQELLSGTDAVINLAGERIIDPPKRWSDSRKAKLRSSRLSVTRNLVEAIRSAKTPPSMFLSGSAIGYYGPRGDSIIDETFNNGDDFLAELASTWERSALEAETVVPVALLRTGIVLGRGGGALPSLLPAFKSGVGGPWGSGGQWWSWIHITDVINLILTIIDQNLTGPYNLVAPNPVTVNDFASTLGHSLRRPTLLRVPEFALRVLLGEAASALLDSLRVSPARALEAGYEFRFPDLSSALQNLT